jgi:hypothetical protein
MKRIFLTLIATLFAVTSVPIVTNAQSRPADRNPGFTGTFRLDRSRSEDVAEIIASAGRLSNQQRREVESSLVPPDSLAIQTSGSELWIGWDGSEAMRLTTDGQTQSIDGMTVRATIRGNVITLVESDNQAELTITITLAGTDGLRISRKLMTQFGDLALFANSRYNKVDSVARFDTAYDDRPAPGSQTRPSPTRPTPTNFIVPNGTYVTAILESDIVTGVSQDNDRFRMTVRAPNEYNGAVIEGYISGISRSGAISGRPEVTFHFDSIRLRNGREYAFAGILVSVTDHEGNTVKIDTEGAAKGDSQGRQAVRRGAIGAGIGAVIGGIIGGGKGAAIGAAIGGGTGAGSVIIEGKEDLKLLKGSSISVQASAPRN